MTADQPRKVKVRLRLSQGPGANHSLLLDPDQEKERGIGGRWTRHWEGVDGREGADVGGVTHFPCVLI
jgi:hypothetical protein